MKIIVDGFGGDNAPLEILKGCAQAVEELGVEIIVTGDDEKLNACAKENGISMRSITVSHAPDVISMEDDPGEIIKSKSGSSMAQALRQLAAGDGEAVVSAGSTGALVIGSTFLVKRIKGIRRCAIGTVMPSNGKPFMLIDSGANAECRPEMLVQFAVMGSVYMNRVMKVEKPRIGLVNIGTEDTKGDPLRTETYGLLKNTSLNFIGNVEAREIPFGACDVAVADGFTGNVVLKLTEGLAGAMMQNIKGIFLKNGLSKLAALAVKSGLREFKTRMDYTEYGGAPLMGISKPVIKAHGSSNAKAVKNAIRQAMNLAETGAVDEIAKNLPKTKESGSKE
mgnify:CR=1 FL=1